MYFRKTLNKVTLAALSAVMLGSMAVPAVAADKPATEATEEKSATLEEKIAAAKKAIAEAEESLKTAQTDEKEKEAAFTTAQKEYDKALAAAPDETRTELIKTIAVPQSVTFRTGDAVQKDVDDTLKTVIDNNLANAEAEKFDDAKAAVLDAADAINKAAETYKTFAAAVKANDDSFTELKAEKTTAYTEALTGLDATDENVTLFTGAQAEIADALSGITAVEGDDYATALQEAVNKITVLDNKLTAVKTAYKGNIDNYNKAVEDMKTSAETADEAAKKTVEEKKAALDKAETAFKAAKDNTIKADTTLMQAKASLDMIKAEATKKETKEVEAARQAATKAKNELDTANATLSNAEKDLSAATAKKTAAESISAGVTPIDFKIGDRTASALLADSKPAEGAEDYGTLRDTVKSLDAIADSYQAFADSYNKDVKAIADVLGADASNPDEVDAFKKAALNLNFGGNLKDVVEELTTKLDEIDKLTGEDKKTAIAELNEPIDNAASAFKALEDNLTKENIDAYNEALAGAKTKLAELAKTAVATATEAKTKAETEVKAANEAYEAAEKTVAEKEKVLADKQAEVEKIVNGDTPSKPDEPTTPDKPSDEPKTPDKPSTPGSSSTSSSSSSSNGSTVTPPIVPSSAVKPDYTVTGTAVDTPATSSAVTPVKPGKTDESVDNTKPSTTTTTKTVAVKKVKKNTYRLSTKAVKFKKGKTKSVKVSTAQIKAVLKKAKTKSTVKKAVYSVDKKYAKYVKINKKTGKITMLKKGKIVIKATMTLKNGKKIVVQVPVTLK